MQLKSKLQQKAARTQERWQDDSRGRLVTVGECLIENPGILIVIYEYGFQDPYKGFCAVSLLYVFTSSEEKRIYFEEFRNLRSGYYNLKKQITDIAKWEIKQNVLLLTLVDGQGSTIIKKVILSL